MADTGDIPNNIALGASQSVRRNATDTGFEAFTAEAGGDISGTTGSTDNAVIRADGVGGSTIQSSLVAIDDAGTINIPTGQTYNVNGMPHTHADTGDIGGSTGSTDNAIIRADGTGGATVQSSLVTIDDSGGMNIPTGQEYKVNNAQHTHVEADLVLSDVTTDDATTTAHGFLPKLPGDAGKYLGGDGLFHDIPTTLSFFLEDTASDISGYKTLISTVPTGGEANVSASITGAAVAIEEWALAANQFDFISTQVLHTHLHAAKTAGVKGVNIFVRIYHRTSGGTETLLGTSENTPAITTKTDYDLHVAVSDTAFAATDRLVIKFLGNQTGSGTDPTVAIYYQGTTLSRVEVGAAPIGGAGSIGGSTGSTDNAVLRADGTGGATVQSSLVAIDDSGGINIPTGQTYNINGSPHTHANGVARSGSTTDAHLAVWNGSNADSLKDGGVVPVVPAFIGALVYHSVNQSVANTGVTVLAFNSEYYDTDTMHDNSTNNSRLTATTAGKYHITGQVTFAAASGGSRTIAIRLGGTTLITAINRLPCATAEDELDTSCDYDLTAGQYVELVCAQSSSGAVNVLRQSDYSPKFSMYKIG